MPGNKRLGLALGGGGARGLAHIGLLQVLEEAGVEVAAICGASVGAIIGAGYAFYRDPYWMEDVFSTFLTSDLYKAAGFQRIKTAVREPDADSLTERLGWQIRRSIIRGKLLTKAGLLDQETFSRVIDFLVADENHEDCKIPFACVALDLTRGRPHVFRTGPLRKTILASAAVAGLVPPVETNGRLMADGVWIYSVPVEPLWDMDVETIIAVDVDHDLEVKEDFGTIIDVILRAQETTMTLVKQHQLDQADLIIHPQVGSYHWSDFEAAAELIQMGREAGQAAMPDIRDRLKRTWWSGTALKTKRRDRK